MRAETLSGSKITTIHLAKLAYVSIRQSSLGSAFGVGITPDALLIDGVAPPQIDGAIADAAALLHDVGKPAPVNLSKHRKIGRRLTFGNWLPGSLSGAWP